MTNRLADAHSAYLLQHAHQGVDWWQYGSDAFAEADRRDVPVFLSIGYAACHWCHVMSAESFDDATIADYLNRNFVAVKVDREEHPDVDAVYMAATQTLTGQGGWPMSVFALPDGRTFHAGTYFPPAPRHGLPSFGQVLAGVNEAWSQRRTSVEEQAGHLAAHLGDMADAQRDLLGLSTLHDAAPGALEPVHAAVLARLAADEDTTGGFGPAPKFPPSSTLDYLLELASAGEHPEALELAGRTFEAMAAGALVDHVGGGFARYCVDAAWRVPHFEKMLYDNAQLLRHAARFAALSDDPDQRDLGARLARGTAGWMRRELLLTDADGRAAGLASSLDADTVMDDGTHIEGATYLFSRAELREAGTRCDVWETLEPLLAGRSPEEPAAPAGRVDAPGYDDVPVTVAFERVPDAAQWRAWDAVVPTLRQVRAGQAQPRRDEKVVAGWNGLAVRALAEAGLLLEEPEMLDLAARLGEYLWREHFSAEDAALARLAYRPGGGLLEDYAGVALGFQALATVAGHVPRQGASADVSGGADLEAGTAPGEWVRRAGEVLAAAEGRFGLAAGGEARDAPKTELLSAARGGRAPMEGLDSATPSALALYATALLNQGGFEAEPAKVGRAGELVDHVRRVGAKAPAQFGTALAAAVRVERDASLAVAGGTDAERAACLRLAVRGGAIALEADADVVPETRDAPALARGKTPGADGGLRAYLCRSHVCAAPVGDAAALEAAMCRRPRS
ncbi:thioredoxin domain-containing protein [Zhihengliuella halotolerans]|uniref:Spermatogenesis-associated protein 20-like TRX domain-containing protein n=1 Tax=Zhihengliuella halotolerans TaxID=370736 RepID=A0A4Q8AD07_9MICC|nr:DUF255 domain-containing protein [Zhihengliuella halotolerans]RZU62107.1 hypothetical protein EV380_1695 [Zhihengliuella halotolerans]